MDVTRSRIQLLSKLLPESDYSNPIPSSPLSAVSSYLTTSGAGTGTDPICRWLYETYTTSDPDLRLVVLSFIPLIAGNYLSRVHSLSSPAQPVAGFEAVLLAVYSSETISRAGKPVVVTIPDLAQSSPYHIGSDKDNDKVEKVIGIVSNQLEPHTVIKSSKRGVILGAVFDSYYKEIAEMQDWSKLDFCKFVVGWAGQSCPCKSRFDQKLEIDFDGNVDGQMKDLEINDGNLDNVGAGGTRIPLPWELLQPVLRILAHCLWAPVVGNDVKEAAANAVRFLYARSSHDLFPRAILATRALIQLHNRERDAAKITPVAITVGSDSNTPTKENKPEIQVV